MNLQAFDPSLIQKPTLVRYKVLAWACTLSMITYVDRVCIKSLEGDMTRDLDITSQQFAWVFSAFGLAYALFEVPSGWLGDRFGPRRVLCRIVLWWSIFTALTGLVWRFSWDSGYTIAFAGWEIPVLLAILPVLGLIWSYWGERIFTRITKAVSFWMPFVRVVSTMLWILLVFSSVLFFWETGYTISWFEWEIPLVFNSLVLLILIRFLFGAGEAGAYPNIARALRNWFPYARRGLAQGLLWMFGRWGGAIAPVLIWIFARELFDWRGAFIAFGIMGLCWVTAFAYYFRDRPQEHPGANPAEIALIQESKGEASKPPPLSWSTMLKSPTLWFLSLMYFCSNAGWCFFITWDVKYYETILELDGLDLSLAAGAPLFFGGIACLCGGFLTDRQVRVWGRRWGRTLQGMAAYFLGGFFFLVALTSTNPWIAVPCLCIASFLKDTAMAVSWSTCIDIGHRYAGTVAGFMNMVGNLGTFVSPPLVAYLAKRGDWDLALVYSAIMFFTASIGWLFINPRRVIVYTPEDHHKVFAQGVADQPLSPSPEVEKETGIQLPDRPEKRG